MPSALPKRGKMDSLPRTWRYAALPKYNGPLLTFDVADALASAREAGVAAWSGSLDLQRSQTQAALSASSWQWHDLSYPYPQGLKDRTTYFWDGSAFAPVSRYSG